MQDNLSALKFRWCDVQQKTKSSSDFQHCF